jgi:diguanylate cyclase (GGDEF)-like protein
MWLLLVAFVWGLTLRDHGWSSVIDGVLGILTFWAPAALCWLTVSRIGFRRWEVPLAAAAVTSYAAGNTCYVLMAVGGATLPFPSPADVGYLLFYPLMLAAITVAVRRYLKGLASSVWLDSAVGSLGAAAALAVLLSPVLGSAVTGSVSLSTLVAVTYPLFDLILVAAIAGIAALGAVRLTSRWSMLGAGLTVFATTDVVYALQVSAKTYVVGTPLDAGWAVGLALMAMWVDGTVMSDGSPTKETHSRTGVTALMVPAAATVAGVGVLVVSSQRRLSPLAVILAAVTLFAAAGRTQLLYRQVARLADLRRQVATDELTGLPNRRALYAKGNARLAERQQRRQALLVLDLDKFKEVNDSLGHHAGDLLLIQVGDRLREYLRAGDLLVRLGGDEFAILLDDTSQDLSLGVAIMLRAALAEPFAMEGIALHTSASIGIALFPDHGSDLSTLLRKADIAMYKAKAAGNGHHVYSGSDEADGANRLETVEQMRTALTRDQLVVHYQPKIDLDTGDVHNVEALVRWDHPTRGLLKPDAFLSLVEEFGLMPALTRVVLTLALDQAAVWHAQGQPLTVAVNLSASSLVDADLPKQVASMLAVRGIPPQVLQLEITEEFLMADRDRARTILAELQHSGVQISVDDFGTGYSSLSYLRDLPIDELKLDRSFILPMAEDPRAAALVSSTVTLAHSLGLRMVAEGVESQATYANLRNLGCDQAQGDFMSRPIPAAELDRWLSTLPATDRFNEMPEPQRSAPRG